MQSQERLLILRNSSLEPHSQRPASIRRPSFPNSSADCALGVIFATRNSAAIIANSIDCVFAAHHSAGWQGSLWIVVIADSCTDATAKVARQAVGAFGQVLEVQVHSVRAACNIGDRLLKEHFADKSNMSRRFCGPAGGDHSMRYHIVPEKTGK